MSRGLTKAELKAENSNLRLRLKSMCQRHALAIRQRDRLGDALVDISDGLDVCSWNVVMLATSENLKDERGEL